MGSARGRAAAIVFLLVVSGLPAWPAGAAGPTLPPVLELPPWAIGFFWTYHYEGSDAQSFAGFTATYINDTYTSSIVAETSTGRGDAWVVRNYHEGTMAGTGPAGIPATADFTSETYYTIRKSDQAVLNYSQDLDITAVVQLLGTIHGHGHNDTYADPPLAQIAFGAPADGTPWRVYSNMTSTGWFQIDPAPRQDTSSYLVVDYNLSVVGTETVTVPAGTFDAYNLSGFGTVDYNGTVYSYSESSLWAPKAQERVRDAAGYLLQSYFVNRPPKLSRPLPPVRIDAGGFNDTLNLTDYIVDPEGAALTFSSCAPDAPLACTVDPTGALNLSAPADVNATLNVTVRADDGFPAGNATFSLVALVHGPGNPNAPPVFTGSALTMDEDTNLTVDLSTLFTDPDGDPVTVILTFVSNLFVLNTNGSLITVRPPPNFNGDGGFSLTAMDTAGNDFAWYVVVHVLPVNDPPRLLPASPLDTVFHAGVGGAIFQVTSVDVDGDSLLYHWTLDGDTYEASTLFSFGPPANMTSGVHYLTVVANDGSTESDPVIFSLLVYEGPRIVGVDPPFTSFRIANNTSYIMGVNVSDADSPTLHYKWTADGEPLAEGDDVFLLNLFFGEPGEHTIAVEVSDNATNGSFEWRVQVEEAPSGLVIVYSPADDTEVAANATVPLIVVVDPRLNATLDWRLDGAQISTVWNDTTPALSPGNHSVTLRVHGLYNQVVTYDEFFNFTIVVKQPPTNNTNNNTTNGGGNHNPPPPPADASQAGLGVLLLLAAVAAAAIGAAVYVRRRGRKAPPSQPPSPPA